MAAVRVSVAAGDRRIDVALPAAVPVAELLPELAEALGAPGAGVTLATVVGRRLAPELGLAAQDVADGCILVLATGRMPPPRIHDDPAEAMAEAVEQHVPRWPDHARRPAALAAGALLLATAAGAALHPLATAAPAAARFMLAAVALLVLAGSTFPRWAVAVVVRRADDGPVDLDRTRADVRAAHRLLLGMVAGSGFLLVAVAPLAAGLGPWGTVLVVDAATVLALRSRHHHSGAEVLAALVVALASVVSTAQVAVVDQPRSLTPVAAVLATVAALVLAGVVVPASARRARAAELLEGSAVVALLPLLVAATGLLPWVRTAVAR